MNPFRLALLGAAALPTSAGVTQTRHPRPPVLAPPPMVFQMPGPPRMADDRRISIFFDYDSASLSPIAEQIVDLAAERARRCHYLEIVIAGHVDTATRRSRAVRLSRRMAETVRSSLIRRGLAPERIKATGYGTAQPLTTTGPGVREPLNRRTEMLIRCPGDPPSAH
jgi:outer membrane protein OmpA-like peptidoglycan-associated protein